MTVVYKVRVIGHGIIFKSVSRRSAQRRADECIPEANATVIAVPESR